MKTSAPILFVCFTPETSKKAALPVPENTLLNFDAFVCAVPLIRSWQTNQVDPEKGRTRRCKKRLACCSQSGARASCIYFGNAVQFIMLIVWYVNLQFAPFCMHSLAGIINFNAATSPILGCIMLHRVKAGTIARQECRQRGGQGMHGSKVCTCTPMQRDTCIHSRWYHDITMQIDVTRFFQVQRPRDRHDESMSAKTCQNTAFSRGYAHKYKRMRVPYLDVLI